MAAFDIIFDSFGLYILGLVLLFGFYDIFLRIWHSHGKRKIGIIFSCIFLLVMGIILFTLSMLFLARLYAEHQILFYSGVIIFLAAGGGTFQIMRWKREIMSEDQKALAGQRAKQPDQPDQPGGLISGRPEQDNVNLGRPNPDRPEKNKRGGSPDEKPYIG